MILSSVLKKPLLSGVLGGIFLIAFYFLILIIANSFSHAVSQFLSMWYWVLALSIGFGSQIGLYAYMRYELNARALASATNGIAASGGVSATSMAACCAHHLTDVLPLLGLSALSVFLLKFQTPLMLLGLLSSFVGLTMMLRMMKRMRLKPKNSLLKRLLRLDLERAFKISVAVSALIFAFSVFLIVSSR